MILDAWGWCTGTTQGEGMGKEEGSGWEARVYLWRIHFYIWQNQYNIVKFKKKKKKKKPPAMEETWVRWLGREDPLEEGMATHSSILAGKIL